MDQVLLRLKLVALGKKTKIRGSLRPEQAIEVEHVPRLGMRISREIHVFGADRRDQRHLIPIFDARHISADLVVFEHLFRKAGIVSLGGDSVRDRVEMFGLQRIDVLWNSLIEPEHVAKPLRIFGIAAVLELFHQEFARSASFLVRVCADPLLSLGQTVAGPLDDLGEPGIDQTVRRVRHRAADQPTPP